MTSKMSLLPLCNFRSAFFKNSLFNPFFFFNVLRLFKVGGCQRHAWGGHPKWCFLVCLLWEFMTRLGWWEKEDRRRKYGFSLQIKKRKVFFLQQYILIPLVAKKIGPSQIRFFVPLAMFVFSYVWAIHEGEHLMETPWLFLMTYLNLNLSSLLIYKLLKPSVSQSPYL